jgi:hypothetical protein
VPRVQRTHRGNEGNALARLRCPPVIEFCRGGDEKDH